MPVLLSEGQGDVVALVMAGARLGQSVADAGDLHPQVGLTYKMPVGLLLLLT